MENPRVETEEHPLETVSTKLPNEFGFEQKISLEKEIYQTFKLLTRPEMVERIKEKLHTILPKTTWSGEKKLSMQIEEYKPGTRKSKGFEGILYTKL